ncbi:MAG: type IV pilus assembly protein PilM [Thermodesulfobacteriota bacterium]|nr:type IV pilus assembly protein PilM [Thermodesulfobacteriota bacterium]
MKKKMKTEENKEELIRQDSLNKKERKEDFGSPFIIFRSKQKRLFSISSKYRIGLDIGSHSIKAVKLKGTSLSAALIGKRLEPEKVKNYLKEIKIQKARVFTAVEDSSIVIKQVSLPLSAKKKLDTVMEWEAPRHIPYSAEDVLINWQTLYTDTEQSKLRVLLVAVKKQLKKGHLGYLSSLGVKPRAVDIAPLALMNSFSLTNPLKDEETIVMVDIGAKRSNLNILKENDLYFTRYLPLGGEKLTEVIQEKIGIDHEQAEELKKMTDSSVFNILEPLLYSFVQDLRKSLAYFDSKSGRKGFRKIILSGGGSRLRYLPQYLTEELGINVELFNPFLNLKGAEDFSNSDLGKISPQFALAFGLALKER